VTVKHFILQKPLELVLLMKSFSPLVKHIWLLFVSTNIFEQRSSCKRSRVKTATNIHIILTLPFQRNILLPKTDAFGGVSEY